MMAPIREKKASQDKPRMPFASRADAFAHKMIHPDCHLAFGSALSSTEQAHVTDACMQQLLDKSGIASHHYRLVSLGRCAMPVSEPVYVRGHDGGGAWQWIRRTWHCLLIDFHRVAQSLWRACQSLCRGGSMQRDPAKRQCFPILPLAMLLLVCLLGVGISGLESAHLLSPLTVLHLPAVLGGVYLSGFWIYVGIAIITTGIVLYTLSPFWKKLGDAVWHQQCLDSALMLEFMVVLAFMPALGISYVLLLGGGYALCGLSPPFSAVLLLSFFTLVGQYMKMCQANKAANKPLFTAWGTRSGRRQKRTPLMKWACIFNVTLLFALLFSLLFWGVYLHNYTLALYFMVFVANSSRIVSVFSFFALMEDKIFTQVKRSLGIVIDQLHPIIIQVLVFFRPRTKRVAKHAGNACTAAKLLVEAIALKSTLRPLWVNVCLRIPAMLARFQEKVMHFSYFFYLLALVCLTGGGYYLAGSVWPCLQCLAPFLINNGLLVVIEQGSLLLGIGYCFYLLYRMNKAVPCSRRITQMSSSHLAAEVVCPDQSADFFIQYESMAVYQLMPAQQPVLLKKV